jgi:hypothetical protein
VSGEESWWAGSDLAAWQPRANGRSAAGQERRAAQSAQDCAQHQAQSQTRTLSKAQAGWKTFGRNGITRKSIPPCLYNIAYISHVIKPFKNFRRKWKDKNVKNMNILTIYTVLDAAKKLESQIWLILRICE